MNGFDVNPMTTRFYLQDLERRAAASRVFSTPTTGPAIRRYRRFGLPVVIVAVLLVVLGLVPA